MPRSAAPPAPLRSAQNGARDGADGIDAPSSMPVVGAKPVTPVPASSTRPATPITTCDVEPPGKRCVNPSEGIRDPLVAFAVALSLDTSKVLALASAGAFAAGSVLIKRMDPGPDLLPVTAWQLILGSLVLLASSRIAERGGRVIWSNEFLSLLIFLAVPGTAVATSAWYWLVQGKDVGRLAMFFFLVPVFGLALASVTYGERIGPFQAAGAMFILAGSGVTVVEDRQVNGPLPGRMVSWLGHRPNE